MSGFLPDTHALVRWLADDPRLHHDRFDRMLVAQTVQERLGLITSDAKIAAYDVTILDAST